MKESLMEPTVLLAPRVDVVSSRREESSEALARWEDDGGRIEVPGQPW